MFLTKVINTEWSPGLLYFMLFSLIPFLFFRTMLTKIDSQKQSMCLVKKQSLPR